jgi:hypothetical protein
MSPNERNYFQSYYAAHREEISRSRRERYKADPVYREQVMERALERYRRVREERIKARNGEPSLPSIRGYNKARIFQVDGRNVLVRSVREFADRVGRDVQTIKAWEEKGVIPPPTVVDELRRRWYAEAHIELLARVARSYWSEGGRSNEGLKERIRAAWEEAKAVLAGAVPL